MTEFLQIWLVVVLLFTSWPLGSLGLRLIHNLTGGVWGDSLRAGLNNGIATTPLIVPALVPLAYGLSTLYPWVHTGHAHFYLNEPFLVVRILFYLLFWLSLAFILARRGAVSHRFAGPALVVLILTGNFWTIDAAQSIDPTFNSTVFALAGLAGMTILALSAAILRSPLAAGDRTVRDLSRLLLALVIFWGYLEFVQALIVWESDLSRENQWLLPRLTGAWGDAAWAIAAVHFFLPFLALLTPAAQASLRNLRTVAILMIAGEALYWAWVVLPAGTPHV